MLTRVDLVEYLCRFFFCMNQVADVFVDFLRGKIRCIPWITADDVAPETNRMVHDLMYATNNTYLQDQSIFRDDVSCTVPSIIECLACNFW